MLNIALKGILLLFGLLLISSCQNTFFLKSSNQDKQIITNNSQEFNQFNFNQELNMLFAKTKNLNHYKMKNETNL